MNVRLSGSAVFVVLLALVVYWLYRQVKENFNPGWFDVTSTDNLIYQGVGGVGDALGVPDTDSRGVALDDYVFALIDKINPFNESDFYADYVLSGRESVLE